jgi:trehalose 6-phosphate synthase/phosphatase
VPLTTQIIPSKPPPQLPGMDSYAATSAGTPSASQSGDLGHIRNAIAKLEADHKAKGTTLSGRIIHLSHYLPVVSSLQRSPAADIPSPPKTPDQAVELSAQQTAPQTADSKPKEPFSWTLSPRRGHTAMHSGIRSLSATHKQLIVAYTGEIHSQPAGAAAAPALVGDAETPGVETIPYNQITDAEKAALEKELRSYKEPGLTENPEIEYVPVFLEDKVAKGHYDGYCKNSTYY